MDQKKRRGESLFSSGTLSSRGLEEDAELDRDVAGLRTVLRECVEVGRGATDIERPWAVVDEDVTNLSVEPLRSKARELIGHADSGIETRSITRVLIDGLVGLILEAAIEWIAVGANRRRGEVGGLMIEPDADNGISTIFVAIVESVFRIEGEGPDVARTAELGEWLAEPGNLVGWSA